MPTVQVPTSELLKAVEQLSPFELSRFTAEVVALRDERMGPTTELAEEELLRLARQVLPTDVHQRYAELRARSKTESLTPDERNELLGIITRSEHLNVSRMEALATLARRRKKSLPEVMDQLGIKAPPYETGLRSD